MSAPAQPERVLGEVTIQGVTYTLQYEELEVPVR